MKGNICLYFMIIIFFVNPKIFPCLCKYDDFFRSGVSSLQKEIILFLLTTLENNKTSYTYQVSNDFNDF